MLVLRGIHLLDLRIMTIAGVVLLYHFEELLATILELKYGVIEEEDNLDSLVGGSNLYSIEGEEEEEDDDRGVKVYDEKKRAAKENSMSEEERNE